MDSSHYSQISVSRLTTAKAGIQRLDNSLQQVSNRSAANNRSSIIYGESHYKNIFDREDKEIKQEAKKDQLQELKRQYFNKQMRNPRQPYYAIIREPEKKHVPFRSGTDLIDLSRNISHLSYSQKRKISQGQQQKNPRETFSNPRKLSQHSRQPSSHIETREYILKNPHGQELSLPPQKNQFTSNYEHSERLRPPKSFSDRKSNISFNKKTSVMKKQSFAKEKNNSEDDEANFDFIQYQSALGNKSKLGQNHHLLQSVINYQLNGQDHKINSMINDKQLNLSQMHRVYTNIRRPYGTRQRERNGSNIEEYSNQNNEHSSFLAASKLKTFRYFGGQDTLKKDNDDFMEQNKQEIQQHKRLEQINQVEASYSPEKAQKILINRSLAKWTKKIQSKQQTTQSAQLSDRNSPEQSQASINKKEKDKLVFVEKLFDYWEENELKKISIKNLYQKLLMFGLSPNEQFITKALQIMKANNGISGEITEIYKNQFMNLFASNKFTQPLIELLNNKLIEQRQQEQQQKKIFMQQQLYEKMQHALQYSMGSKTNRKPVLTQSNTRITSKNTTQNKLLQSKEYDSFVDAFMDPGDNSNHSSDILKKNFQRQLGGAQSSTSNIFEFNFGKMTEQLQKQDKVKIKHFNIKDYEQIVQKLWESLDTNKTNEISKNSLSNFMKNNKIIQDRKQLEDFLKLVTSEGSDIIHVSKANFFQIFSKPILYIGLSNALTLINKKALNFQLDQDLLPSAIEILKYQREVLYTSFDNPQKEDQLNLRTQDIIQTVGDYGRKGKVINMKQMRKECEKDLLKIRQQQFLKNQEEKGYSNAESQMLISFASDSSVE